MGDRALVIFKDKTGAEISPTVYLHWQGSEVPNLLKELSALMDDRKDDVSYACARFTGICHEHNKGNLSLGIWNTPKKLEKAIKNRDEKPLTEYSHGDAGVIIVDCSDFRWTAYGGYLTEEKAA